MNNLTLEQKIEQFHEFFMIKHTINVNLKLLDDDFVVPSLAALPDYMPYAFRIASEMAVLESSALRPLRHLGEHASELADFLNHQSRKIDLMMSYILHQQDDESQRYQSVEFGGGGITLASDEPINIGTVAEMKVFLSEEAAAVFCFAEVIACHQVEDKYHISLIFNRIREEDQELLVRASLHQQTVQLRERSKQQKNDTD